MNADQLDWLTERVLGALFEVTNTPGAGFLEKVYQRALLRELGLRGIRAVAEASFTVTYKGHLCRRVLCRSPRRRRVGRRAEMCRSVLQRAHCAVSQLSASLRPDRLSSGQFPEAESRVEAYRPGVWGLRTAWDAGRGGVDTTWFVHPLSIHFLDTTLARVDRPQKAMVCPTYRVDSRGTRMGSINIVLAGRLRLETMDLISMSAACRPMAVLLWSMVESGTRSRSE